MRAADLIVAAQAYLLVLCCVSSDEFVAQAVQTSNGTKMPRANWPVLLKYPVPSPPPPLLAQFDGVIKPIVENVIGLGAKIRVLRATRDLLLPKLISGELDVSRLDEAPVEAVV